LALKKPKIINEIEQMPSASIETPANTSPEDSLGFAHSLAKSLIHALFPCLYSGCGLLSPKAMRFKNSWQEMPSLLLSCTGQQNGERYKTSYNFISFFKIQISNGVAIETFIQSDRDILVS
jgi:hypothetical protein